MSLPAPPGRGTGPTPKDTHMPARYNPPTHNHTLWYARQWLRTQLSNGTRCPCCNQYAKIYDRVITSTVARDLIMLYRCAGREWYHMPSLLRTNGRDTGGDTAKARYWGLIEPNPGEHRNGWWRFTDTGEAYVKGRHSVPRYARIYDGRCLELTGPLTDIRAALTTRFNYRQLMDGVTNGHHASRNA